MTINVFSLNSDQIFSLFTSFITMFIPFIFKLIKSKILLHKKFFDCIKKIQFHFPEDIEHIPITNKDIEKTLYNLSEIEEYHKLFNSTSINALRVREKVIYFTYKLKNEDYCFTIRLFAEIYEYTQYIKNYKFDTNHIFSSYPKVLTDLEIKFFIMFLIFGSSIIYCLIKMFF